MDLNGKQFPSTDSASDCAILVNRDGAWVAAQPEDVPGVQPNFVQRPGGAVAINPKNNTVYLCGEVSALTITNVPALSIFVVRLTSGSTPAKLRVPEDVFMPDEFEIAENGVYELKANQTYELNIMDKYCMVYSWEVTV